MASCRRRVTQTTASAARLYYEDYHAIAGPTWRNQIAATIDLCRQAHDALLRNVAPRLTLEVLLSRLALRAA